LIKHSSGCLSSWSKIRENLKELAKELGIRVELIYRWRTEFLDKGAGSFPGHGKPKHTPEEAEIAKLKKQLREVELERDMDPMRTHV
jgi:transposase-like protein